MFWKAIGIRILAVSCVLCCARPSFAEASMCAAMIIDADASIRERWPSLMDQARATFADRDDVDRCAHVTLKARDAGISVEVILADGRAAVRSAARPEDVIPTLEALLVLPQGTEHGQTLVVDVTPPEPPSANPHPSAILPLPVPEIRSDATPAPDRMTSAVSPSQTRTSSHLRIELSVITGARIGDGQAALGLGAFSVLDLSGWLVGFEGRADRYTAVGAHGTPNASTLELALLGGRRLRFRNVSWDFVGGLAGVLQGTTTFAQVSPSTETDASGSTSSVAPRFLLSTRVNVGAESALRSFIGIDGEIGPRRDGDGADFSFVPRLPVWTLGLALGATVGTR